MKKIFLLIIILLTNIIVLKAVSLQNNDQTITIKVINSNDNEYVLDILFFEEEAVNENDFPIFPNTYLEKINLIKEYMIEDGFTNSLIRGSVENLAGDLKGIKFKGNRKIHTFTYNTFQEDSFGKSSERKITSIKIIIVDEINNIEISDELIIKQYHSNINYNYENNIAVVSNPSLDIILFTLFIVFVSLAISLFLFIKMKFNIKEYFSKFGIITGLGSITVTILVANAMYYDNGLFALYSLLILGTINIIVQALIFSQAYKNIKAFAFGILSPLVNMIVTLLVILLI